MSKSNSSKFNIFSKGDNVSHRTGELHFSSYTASQGNGMILFTHNGTANNRNLDFRIDNSSKLKIDNSKIEINTHILPSSNAVYDLGSAEYKIRHLFLSDNSLWIGDAHKISIDNGQMKFRKRKTNVMPKSIQNTFPGGNDEAKRTAAEQHRETWAAANASGVTLQNMKLNHWEAYAKTIDGINSKGLGLAEVNDIFRTNEVDDYEEQFGSNSWIESGANIHTLVTNVGIGVANPKTKLEIDGTVTTKKYRQKFIVKAAGGKYHINGRINPIITLQRGKEYEFDLSDSSTNGHPFYITHSSNGGSNGSTGAIAKKYDTQDGLNMVTGNGNHAGTTNKTVIFSVPDNAPGSLYYHCSAHSGMGNKINIDGTLLSDSLGKTRITVDATSNENIIRFNTNNEERVKIENDKTVFKFPVELHSAGDIALKIKADTDNVDENDNALLVLSQDNDTVKMEMGGVGSAGQIYTNSLANAQYIMANSTNSAINTSLQLVTKDGSNPLTSRMTILHNGKVGIGTNNPGTIFEIIDSQPYITLRNNKVENPEGGCESRIIFEDHGGNRLAQIQGSHDGANDDTKGDLIFSTNSGSALTERMRIDSNGNVGIGVNNPGGKLDIQGTNTVTHFNYLGDEHTYIRGGKFTSNVIINDTGGNVGIGDNAPGTQLQITGSEPYLTLKNSTAENTDGGCESKIIFEDHADNALGQIQVSHDGTADDTKGNLIFSTSNGIVVNEVMKINSNGNVGIGTTNPESSLTIKGNINNYKESNYPYRLTSLALNANGETNQYAYSNDATAISATNFAGNTQLTIEIWFKTISTDDSPRYIFVKGNHGYSIQINCQDRKIGYIDNYGTTGFGHGQYIYTVDNVFEINKWQHLAVTVNTATGTYGQLNFYINGINVHTYNGTSSKYIEIRDVWNGGGNNKALYLGTSPSTNTLPQQVFQGYLADLRIWNTELSQSTIQAWYDKDLNSNHPNYANLGNRSWAFDSSVVSDITYTMKWDLMNSYLSNNETWTDEIKSGKNVIGGFIATDRSNIRSNLIINGRVAIGQDYLNSSANLHVNNTIATSTVYAASYLSFTGGHTSITKEQHNNINNNNNIDLINDLSYYLNRIGYIVRSTGKYYNENSDLEREKPTINESIPIIELTKTEKDISSFGIISRTFEQNEVKRLIINSLGEGAIMVSNYNGNIINGHYITSSSLEGLGMKQDSEFLANYTVAKSTQDEDFTSDYQEITHTNGQTYRYKLIGCTYHCG